MLSAVLSAIRGERDDVKDKLYRIAPDSLLLALDYHTARFSGTLEWLNVADQNRVSLTNAEATTSGYSLVNLAARIQLQDNLEVGAGIDNLFDRYYLDHLAAYNRAFNPELATFSRLPGTGRNLYARVIWHY